MSKIMNDNFQIEVGNPIDAKYLASTNQPYANPAAVLSAIPESQRYIGLTVNVANVEYWFYNGVADGNFQIKDSGIASTGITNASNGLTKVGDAVILGGTLTGDTLINVAGKTFQATCSNIGLAVCGGDSKVVLGDINVGNSTWVSVDKIGSAISSRIFNGAGTAYVVNNMLNTGITMKAYDNAVNNECSCFELSTTGVACLLGSDNIEINAPSGATYAAAYRANFTDLSLVDKCYVDSAIGNIPSLTYNNGITKLGDVVSLGGALTGDTTVSGAHTMQFTNTTFNANATNIGLSGIVGVTGAVNVSGAIDANSSLNVQGATGLQSTLTATGATTLCSTLTLPTVVAGTTSNPIMVLDSGVVKCVPASSYNVTATNGITATGNAVKLGSATALSETTNILGGTQILNLGTTGSNLAAFQVNAASANILTTGNIGICPTGTLTLRGSAITAYTVAKYDAEKTYDSLSLPSAGWVTGKTSQAILTATNGLTKTGTAVCLGGAITKNTDLTGSYLFGIHTNVVNVTGDTSVNLGGTVYLKTSPTTATGDVLTINASTGAIQKTTLSSLGGLTGATNGIGTTGQKVCLGGTLAAPTTISGTQLLTLGDLNGICLSTANVTDIGLNAKSNGAIYLKSQNGTVASSNDPTDAIVIALDYNSATPMLITDNSAAKHGLVYATDYSNTFQDHSLVDKYYVDSIATGLNVHAAVAAASEINLPLSGDSGSVDGVSVASIIATNNRILIKSQTDGTENGIYSASTGIWGRTDDYNFNPSGEIANGDLIPVTSGNTEANSQWILVTANPIVSGVTSLEYSLFAQQFGITDGNGICVTTVGTNKNVAVRLSTTNPGLCFDSQALEIDYNIFRNGLTCSVTTGKVDVRATVSASVGDEILVRIDTGGTNTLFVDKNDFSYTTANNGLSKQGCNVVLGGVLTGATTISMASTTGLAFTDTRATKIGLQYSGDYKADFTTNSLINKSYADACDAKVSGYTLTAANDYTDTLAGATITGATSGLCIDDTDSHLLCLGGTLAAATVIDVDSFNFNVCDGNTNVGFGILAASSLVEIYAPNGNGDVTALNIRADYIEAYTEDAPNFNGFIYAGGFTTQAGAKLGCSIPDIDWITGNTSTGTVESVAALNLATTGTDISSTVTSGSGPDVTINLCIPTASATNRGALSSADWTTFNDKTTCVGTVTSVAVNGPLTGGTITTSGTLGITQATTSVDGYLSSTDWNTFNDKTTCLGTVTSADNGLSATSTTVSLGGALTGETNITGGNSQILTLDCLGSFKLNVNDNTVGDNFTFTVHQGSTTTGAVLSNESIEGVMAITLDNAILLDAGSGTTSLRMSTSGTTFTDNGNKQGIEYADDYSLTFNDNSLVTKSYVDTAVSTGVGGAITGATNGLTKSGQDVKLGGTLSETTTIAGGANTFCLTSTAGVITLGNTSDQYITIGQNADTITMGSNAAGKIDINTAGVAITAANTCLLTTPATGTASDAVLVWNSADKIIKQVSADNLGEDNNVYAMTVVTSNVTLTTGSSYVQLINNATSGLTITLPASPIDGQVFRIKDAAGAALNYPITIARNGKEIDGGTNDGILNTDGGALELVYNNSLNSWFVFSFVN